MMDAQAITIWAYEDAPEDLRSLAKTDKPAWLALIPRTYADYHDLFWLEHIDILHDPEEHPHPSLSEYQVWIGRHG
jgi:hypothetical protein